MSEDGFLNKKMTTVIYFQFNCFWIYQHGIVKKFSLVWFAWFGFGLLSVSIADQLTRQFL